LFEYTARVARWKQRFAALQRPVMAPFVGSQTKAFRFDAEVAGELIETALRTLLFLIRPAAKRRRHVVFSGP
jgi:hypothetical protein